MKALVVYDSVYGNTRAIAEAIGKALPGEVPVLHVTDVQPSDLQSVDLLVIGSPTHGAMPSEAMQSLIERMGPPAREGSRAAAFDTRLTWGLLERWGGFAASKIADSLRGKGWTLIGEPGGFLVGGIKKGPLKKGELERAAAWAKCLVEGQAS
jgi:flavodoxin I